MEKMARRNIKRTRFSRKKRAYPRRKSYSYKRYKRPASKYVTNSTSVSGFTNGKVVKMPYNDFHSFISTAGTQSFATINMASIYDPDTGGGTNHQPYGRDEYATFYNRYVVLGAKITTKFVWNQNATRPVLCFALLDDDTTLPADRLTKRERYPAKCQMLLADKTKSVSINNYYSASKWHKIAKSALMADHQIGAVMGNNPTKYCYLNFGVQTGDGLNTSDQIDVHTQISFIVKLMDPKPILGS